MAEFTDCQNMRARPLVDDLKCEIARLQRELHESRADYEALRARYIITLTALQGMTDLFGAGRVVIDTREKNKVLAAAYDALETYLKQDAPSGGTPVVKRPNIFECTADAPAGEIFDFLDRHVGATLRMEFVSGTITGKILSVGIRYARIERAETSVIAPDTNTVAVVPWRGLRAASRALTGPDGQ